MNIASLAEQIVGNAPKKARIENTFRSYRDEVFGSIMRIHDSVGQSGNDPSLLEVEVRIGMIVSNGHRLFPRTTKQTASLYDSLNMPVGKFRAGMDEAFAKNLKNSFTKEKFKILPTTTQILYVSDRGGDRYEYDSSQQKLQYLDQKTKVIVYDIALHSFDYDIRVATSTEIPGSTNATNAIDTSRFTPQSLLASGYRERTKIRSSYYLQNVRKIWRMDYTEVITKTVAMATTSDGMPNQQAALKQSTQKEYEIEFELDADFQRMFFQERNEQRRMEYGNEICFQLLQLIEHCIPTWSETPNMVKLQPVPTPKRSFYDTSIISLTQLITKDHAQYANRMMNKVEFVGSMPINLFRSSLQNVLMSSYYITEKTDGVRYLCYIFSSKESAKNECIFLDRAKNVFQCPGCEYIAQGFPAGTILDGEIVFNCTFQQGVFLIFDVLCYSMTSMIDETFEARYRLIQSVILPQYIAYSKATPYLPPTNTSSSTPSSSSSSSSSSTATFPPLIVLAKKFVPKHEISHLITSIQQKSGSIPERIFQDKSTGSHHKTDGIIFQPNLPYLFSKNYDLYKWKWTDLRSIDLAVTIRSNTPSMLEDTIKKEDVLLWFQGPEKIQIPCSTRGEYYVGLGEFDCYRLFAELMALGYLSTRESNAMMFTSNGAWMNDWQQSRKGKPIIIEAIYDIHVGVWRYEKIRSDKSDPNYIDSVLGVFIEQAEAIDLEELEYSLLLTHPVLSNGNSGNGNGNSSSGNSNEENFENDYEMQFQKMKGQLLKWHRDRMQKAIKQRQSQQQQQQQHGHY